MRMIRLSRIVSRGLALGSLLFTVSPAKSLLVLPVTGNMEDVGELAAVTRLFRDALESRHGDLAPVPAVSSSTACGEKACALEAARAANLKKSDQVVYSTIHRLGTKLIFTSSIVRADGRKAFNQRMTVEKIEDMEAVTQRMAEALLEREDPEFIASVDDVTDRERTYERAKRKSPYSMGVGVGYLFPVNGGFNYLEPDPTNTSYPYSPTDYPALLRVSWIHTWEFRRDIHFGLEGAWTQPQSFGGDLNLTYLMGGGDFAFFFGGGGGLHYVTADEDPVSAERRNFGPAVNGQAGVILFRTYGLNVKLRGQYLAVFNDDRDQGVVVDVAVMFN
jgi:hypothetical protein